MVKHIFADTTKKAIADAVRGILQHARVADGDTRIFVASTGAGARIQSYLWDMPGASKFLAGACFPYARNEMIDFLGFTPDQYCSEETAIHMAMASFSRATEAILRDKEVGFLEPKHNPIGVGLTSSVATSKAHRGEHRVYCAVFTRDDCFLYTYTLDKREGMESREVDGYTCDLIGLNAILTVLGLSPVKIEINVSSGFNWDIYNLQPAEHSIPEKRLRELFFQYPIFEPDGTRWKTLQSRIGFPAKVFLPGSFNPIHAVHRVMTKTFEERYHKPVMLMITADCVHKDPLLVNDLLERAAMMRLERWRGAPRTLIFTQNDPLFIDKARNMPGSWFLIGADTMIRLLEPKWYSKDNACGKSKMIEMLGEFRRLDTKFLVFGRRIPGNIYVKRSEIEVPAGFEDIFVEVEPGDGMEWPSLSSTQIREEIKQKSAK